MFGTFVKAANSIEKLEDGLYSMELTGDYGFDEFLAQGGADSDSGVADFLVSFLSHGFYKNESRIETDNYGCSTIYTQDKDGALFWGFFEGFNYVVIRDKISACYPSKYRFFDWGALVCAIMCILIHGAVGVTPEAVLEMLATFILIYGMLIVRKETGNAWGCILIFFVYWNAF